MGIQREETRVNRCVIMAGNGKVYFGECVEAEWPYNEEYYNVLIKSLDLPQHITKIFRSNGIYTLLLCRKTYVTILPDDFPYNLETV